ncbi:MAG: hypothetical protein PHW18_05440 [Sulfuricurvum sp.]|uniref:hypothetical protein n=1 Tax=Sulfuricurvum sp. TaxID=2025608 RepID=UPI00260D6CCB|nr:hypothetical protein [Sulfuricurvum sp.]MDD2829000.1 hypothetical protein [Sulfuricurvum sp.]MDD4949627.1 hypothetical protein [Sulfuricurvum sp.]
MSNVKVDIKLRPIRFVFLVKPNDKKNILKIFQINTFLWGGKFNPIIPFFKQVPKWWSKHDHLKYNAQQIINDYLDFFEPDFIVEAEKGLADNIDFDKDRILSLDNMLHKDEYRSLDEYGLNVNDLYIHLYEKKYQFERRHKVDIVNVISKEKSLKNFISCTFGSFPEDEDFSYLEKNYIDIFEPASIELDAKSLLELYSSQYFAPIDIGHTRIDINFFEKMPEPRLFIFDLEETKDLIDFWNLRIIYREVIAIPKQWIKELSPFCKEFILKHHRPSPWQPDYMLNSTTMFSRSISDDEAKNIYSQYIQIDTLGANHIQLWYPNIKLERSNQIHGLRRPILTYQQDSKEVNLLNEEDSRISFDILAPDFSEKYGNKVRWANVINIEDWSSENKITTVFPTNYRNPIFPKFGIFNKHLLSTTEGLIIFPEYKDNNEHWRLENGTVAINQWLKEYDISAIVSDAGKATQQIIETIGGVTQVWSIVNKNIIKTLDEMARTPLTRSFQVNKFENMINKDIKKQKWILPRSEYLASQKIVELGLEVKCSKCDSWSWYTLKELDYSLTCSRCLKKFDFPITKPSKSEYSRWSYRVIGPFAIPDYARGGYATALTIHFFERSLDNARKLKMTWSAGQELTLKSGEKAEADFILWTQKQEILELNKTTNIVFGEAKSFAQDAFKDSDIEKMKLLAETFPNSILVFATMKDHEEFSKDEINRLRKFAEWGRRYNTKNYERRAHIMILTGLELFIEDYAGFSSVWKNKGGKHQELISAYTVNNLNNLEILAELTQQVYLDMPSY